MNTIEFKEALKSPKKVYCLVSSDSAIIDLCIARFKQAINANRVVYGDIYKSNKLLKQTNLSVLYMSKVDEEIFETDEYIFIHTDSIDKRTSLYKKYKNQIIEPDANADLVKYATNKGVKNAELFVKYCNHDMGIINNTISLLNIDRDYEVTDYSNDTILWVHNFIANKELPVIRESPFAVMALLSTNCQALLDIDSANPYLVNKIRPLIGCRTDDELCSIINDCFLFDLQIKSGMLSLDRALNCLCGKYLRG